jgi:deoxyribodipyrimidine photo-lyase
MKLGIFIFRRDHRLIDNLGLIKLSKLCDTILPIFIFDKNQINKTDKNKYYRSDPAIQFMVESLEDLDKQLKEKQSNLYLFYGEPHKIVESLIKLFDEHYDLIIGFNSDFSLYAKQRDNKIIDVCEKYKIDQIIEDSDLSLIDIKNLTKTKDGYKQYGAFLKHVKKFPVPKPITNTKLKFIHKLV